MVTRTGSFLAGVGCNFIIAAAAIPPTIALQLSFGWPFWEACSFSFLAGLLVLMQPLNLKGKVLMGAFMSGKAAGFCLFGLLYWAVCAELVAPAFGHSPMVWSMVALGASGCVLVVAAAVLNAMLRRMTGAAIRS